jgi:hypothetical protein
MKYKSQIIQTGIAWLLLFGFMMATRPSVLPVMLLIVPFVLLFWALTSTWRLVILLRARYMAQKPSVAKNRFPTLVSVCLILLLILQSLGQLTLRDGVTVAALASLGYFYAVRVRPERDKKR